MVKMGGQEGIEVEWEDKWWWWPLDGGFGMFSLNPLWL